MSLLFHSCTKPPVPAAAAHWNQWFFRSWLVTNRHFPEYRQRRLTAFHYHFAEKQILIQCFYWFIFRPDNLHGDKVSNHNDRVVIPGKPTTSYCFQDQPQSARIQEWCMLFRKTAGDSVVGISNINAVARVDDAHWQPPSTAIISGAFFRLPLAAMVRGASITWIVKPKSAYSSFAASEFDTVTGCPEYHSNLSGQRPVLHYLHR